MTKEVKVGEVYLGKVVRIEKFGAFVNLIKGKDGLVHISQLANDRVNKVEDVVKLGDEILVKVTEIDKQGRVNLSRKAMLNEDGSTKMKKNNLIHRNNVLVIVKVTGDNNYSKRDCDKSRVTVLFRINGVQKLASAVISPAKLKTLGAVLFGCSYYLMQNSFYNLSINDVQSAVLDISSKTAKYEELFFRLFL